MTIQFSGSGTPSKPDAPEIDAVWEADRDTDNCDAANDVGRDGAITAEAHEAGSDSDADNDADKDCDSIADNGSTVEVLEESVSNGTPPAGHFR
jgi:hypothetical protein